jgi:2-dehydropantoate 2-reductase
MNDSLQIGIPVDKKDIFWGNSPRIRKKIMMENTLMKATGSLHVLGAGAVGLFHAHLFAKRFPGKVTLLKRNPQRDRTNIIFNSFESSKETSECILEQIGKSNNPIHNLIVATRAYDAFNAVNSIRSRLEDANVLLLTNGVLRVRNDLNSLSINNMFLGVTTHGVVRNDEYEITHAGKGETWIDSRFKSYLDMDSVNNVTRQEMEKRALLKIAINACINPLTAILNCKNGQLTSETSKPLIREIAIEISKVTEFDPNYLEKVVEKVVLETRMNTNSMLVDVQNHRMTEIDYINGYISALGRDKGIPLVLNDLLTKLVHAKRIQTSYRIG